MDSRAFLRHLLETILSPCTALVLVESQLAAITWAFSGFSVLLFRPHHPRGSSFVVSLKSGSVRPPTLFSFLKAVSALCAPFQLPVNFRIRASVSAKQATGTSFGTVLVPQTGQGSVTVPTTRRVSQSVNIRCLFLHLGLQFLPTPLCSF